MEKKELKKIELKKDEVINLNNEEMGDLKGGSTWACATVTLVTYITYDNTKERSWWSCPTT
ncbi:rSAM-modified peptide [Dysgonomonas sp. HDW5A]|uniref:TIGR04149 family rSAM-modified RiPP n=1 Tax=Dysgonomonas sp. HDW5A TaxID=2714926 RepID=UPI00140E77AB|nr:TIGR04149 family rSAM-modified RiPP [Dysgonomonas sp. HDW5A]QIK61406.1 rSAM-modified peptide [Dysgonomonas sp. HDW5A]